MLLYSTKNRSGILESKNRWAYACMQFKGIHKDYHGLSSFWNVRLGYHEAVDQPGQQAAGNWLWPLSRPSSYPDGPAPCGAAPLTGVHFLPLPPTVTMTKRSCPETFCHSTLVPEEICELLTGDWVTSPFGGSLGRLKTLAL